MNKSTKHQIRNLFIALASDGHYFRVELRQSDFVNKGKSASFYHLEICKRVLGAFSIPSEV